MLPTPSRLAYMQNTLNKEPRSESSEVAIPELRDVLLFSIAVMAIALTALVVLAVSYWLIFREDAKVLITISSVVGAVIGAILKSLIDFLRRGG